MGQQKRNMDKMAPRCLQDTKDAKTNVKKKVRSVPSFASGRWAPCKAPKGLYLVPLFYYVLITVVKAPLQGADWANIATWRNLAALSVKSAIT